MFRASSERSPLLVVAFHDKVFGMHPQTGQRLWSQDVGPGAGALRVLVHGERVYVLASAIACLEYATGRLLWRTEVDWTFRSGALLADGERIFLGDAGEVAAFDANTGQMLWHDKFKGQGVGAVALAVPGFAVQANRTG